MKDALVSGLWRFAAQSRPVRVGFGLFVAAFATGPVRAADYPPLNTPPTAEYFPGKIVWADLVTKDPTASESFYTGLFGWTASHVERPTATGPHTNVIFSIGDRPVAEISHRAPSAGDQADGEWIGFLSVPDVAQAVGQATAHGARLLSKTRSVAQRGSEAIIADPDGAIVGLMHSSTGDPGEYLPDPGDFTWAELFAKAPVAAGQFYQALAGYTVQAETRPGEPDHLILVSGGFSRASIATVPDRPRAHPAWLLYVRVADVKAATAKAASLGGRVALSPWDSPSQRWRAVIADPNGAHIGLVQLDVPSKTEVAP